jgi:hypothetical protein
MDDLIDSENVQGLTMATVQHFEIVIDNSAQLEFIFMEIKYSTRL